MRSHSDRRVKYTAEGLRTSQTHQRVDVVNTDHKNVAMFHVFWPHLHSYLLVRLFALVPVNLFKRLADIFDSSLKVSTPRALLA